MKKENEVKGKQLEQVVGGNDGGGAIYNDGATNPISGVIPDGGGAIYNDGAAAGAFGLGKCGALAPNEVPNAGTDHAGIGGGGK